MRYYTKEWNRLMMSLGTAELFRPVIDKEYSDEEFADLYQEFRDMYIEEERAAYDQPPMFFDFDEESDDDEDEEEFDPEDYLIGDTESGDDEELHHPEDFQEFIRWQKIEFEREMKEFEEREPFDEEEAGEEFDENYRDNLEEPDEDIPEWIRETVDPRLLAIWALPERAYKKLVDDEQKMQERFDELDAAADDALERMYEELSGEYDGILEDLDDIDGDYVTGLIRNGSELELVLSGWDEDGDPITKTALFDGVQILEDEGIVIEVERDEDGDIESSCDVECHELYFENGRFEVHFMFDDGDLKYLTFTCDDITVTQESAE